MVIQNNNGDNLATPGNGVFTFNTPIADGSTYDVSVFVSPNTQPGVGVVTWFYQGTATSAVTSVVVDGGHNDWAYFDGPKTGNQKGAIPAPPPGPPTFDNLSPGGRKYPATWTDFSGNLWLFGGYGLTYLSGVTPPATELNDMWEYVGTQSYFGGYNNYWQNLQAPFTPPMSGPLPAPRSGAVTWTQPGINGDLFMFGGENGGNFLNSLWRYNIVSNVWTLVNAGGQNGVYGTLGVAAAGNIPGARWGATAKLDANGILWMFGGFGYDSVSSVPGILNDLWTYNTGTNQWTWVGGSKLANQAGNYGTQGVTASSNTPGARQASMCWLDLSGNFWLFGGFDLDSKGNPDALNDLWEFKPGSPGQWTWVTGANVVNATGVYGTQGVAAATNVPGARWSSAAWTDAIGNFYLFGGEGYDSSGNGSLADLWVYSGGKWIWVKGPASVGQAGVYGLDPAPIIYPYVGNYPGSRYAPGYWIDQKNQLWMFGGEGFDSTGSDGTDLLSDLWRYLPYPHYPSFN